MTSQITFASSTFNRGDANNSNGKGFSYDTENFFQFSFGAESNISLVGASFLGLAKDSKINSQTATVCLEVTESTIFKKPGALLNNLLPRCCYPVVLKKDEPVVVEFLQPVKITKGNWTDVLFNIEGPPTQTLMERTKWTNTYLSKDGLVWFHTIYSRSPLQLQELYFLIPA